MLAAIALSLLILAICGLATYTLGPELRKPEIYGPRSEVVVRTLMLGSFAGFWLAAAAVFGPSLAGKIVGLIAGNVVALIGLAAGYRWWPKSRR